MTIEIRPLSADDVLAWRTLRAEALADAPEAFGASPEEHAALDDDAIAARIADDGASSGFGAFDDGRLVGFAGFSVETGAKFRHRGWLWGVYVTPSARGRGLSARLVRAVVERARAHVEVLRADVGVSNVSAKRVYLAAGFIPFAVDRKVLKVGGAYVDEDLLRLDFEVG